MALAAPLPIGAVTFAFTDIEGSTARWERDRDAMQEAVRRHDAILRAAIVEHGGHVFKTVGDAFCAAFARPKDAVAAMLAAQQMLAAEDFSTVDGLRVRVALHTGFADERDGDYFGPVLNRVARLLAIAHGGQVLISGDTAELSHAEIPPQGSLRDLGFAKLKDLSAPEHVWQLDITGLPSEFPPLRALDSLPNNLPLQRTTFVGREQDVAEVKVLLDRHWLLTLVGSGGVGKTRLAIQVGAELLDRYPDGVWFVDLAPIGDPELVASVAAQTSLVALASASDSALVLGAIASALGVHEVAGHPLLETLMAYLKSKALLLIFDNCENVITEAAAVAGSLLTGCSNLRILATSREPLRIAGEYTYRLPSLSVPTQEAAGRLSTAEALSFGAIVLFNDRARAINYRFTLTDQNASTAAQICRRLDGIPLAIELAAARVNVLTVQVISKKLDHRFAILTGSKRAVLPRQQTMRAAIDWSYDLLEERERRVFERLSVFAGGCTMTTANAVCIRDDVGGSDIIDLLSSLVDKSLLVANLDGVEPRYVLLESFREYAREKLAARGEQDAVARRHAVACLELAEQLERACDTEPDVIWRALAQDELDNWRAALQWTLSDRNDVVLGQALVGALHVVWAYFAPLEGQRYTTAALALADEQTPTHVLARLGYAEGIVAMQLRAFKAQFLSSERAIERYRAAGDRLGIARTQDLAAQALVSLGRIAEAKVLLHEALTAARTLGNRRLVACVLRNLGYASAVEGDCNAARDYVVEAVPIYEALGASLGAALARDDLGEIEFRAGNAELAFQLATDALATFRAANNQRFVASILSSLAMYLIALGRYDDADKRACEALALAREQQQDVLVAWSLQHLGAIAALRPHASARDAAKAYCEAARILGFVDARLEAAGSARMYIYEQGYDRALTVLRQAIGADAVASFMAEGTKMTEKQVVEEASVRRSLELPA